MKLLYIILIIINNASDSKSRNRQSRHTSIAILLLFKSFRFAIKTSLFAIRTSSWLFLHSHCVVKITIIVNYLNIVLARTYQIHDYLDAFKSSYFKEILEVQDIVYQIIIISFKSISHRRHISRSIVRAQSIESSSYSLE